MRTGAVLATVQPEHHRKYYMHSTYIFFLSRAFGWRARILQIPHSYQARKRFLYFHPIS